MWLLGAFFRWFCCRYIAAETELCEMLLLEDPPFFASQGERRKSTFNYIDLSTVCHTYISQEEKSDFVLYYFCNQYAWNLFPEHSRDKVKGKLVKMAAAYRTKHPSKDLKVLFWPKASISRFSGYESL